jgi:hypothetical protein
MLNGIKAETKCIGKAGLGHLQALSYTLDIDLSGQVNLVADCLASQKGIHFVQSGHQVVKQLLHGLPPVSGKDFIGAPGEIVALFLRQIFLFVLRIDGDEEDRKGLAAQDINHTRTAALSHAAARN